MNRCLWPIAAMALIFAAPAVATVALQVNSSGVVTGATGVNVAGSLYDVNFVDGTCASVFGTCDSAHFAFTTDTSAVNASQALLDQVFVGPFAIPATDLWMLKLSNLRGYNALLGSSRLRGGGLRLPEWADHWLSEPRADWLFQHNLRYIE